MTDLFHFIAKQNHWASKLDVMCYFQDMTNTPTKQGGQTYSLFLSLRLKEQRLAAVVDIWLDWGMMKGDFWLKCKAGATSSHGQIVLMVCIDL